MAQGDMNIANQGFPSFRADLNDQLEALVTNSSGATAPSTTFPHQWWLDTSTTPNTLRQRNEANDAWIAVGQFDQASNKFILTADDLVIGTDKIVTSGNNVGIGTSSPSQLLEVNGAVVATSEASTFSVDGIYLQNKGGGLFDVGAWKTGASTGNITFSTSPGSVSDPIERVRITGDGDVAIGRTSAGEQLHVEGNIRTQSQFIAEANDTATAPGYSWRADTNTGIFRPAANTIGFSVGGSEASRFNSAGNFLVGTTTPTINSSNFGTRISDVLGHSRNATGAVAQFYGTTGENRFLGNGSIQNTLNSYGAISDAKLKENIVDATPKLDKLMQVRVVNYNLKTNPDDKLLGVVAQELEQIFPGMVDNTPDEDGEGKDLGTTTKAVKYSVFVPMLIKAIQELKAEVDAQAAEIAALKGQ